MAQRVLLAMPWTMRLQKAFLPHYRQNCLTDTRGRERLEVTLAIFEYSEAFYNKVTLIQCFYSNDVHR